MSESSPLDELFYDQPPGAFSEGHVFGTAPDLTSAIDDPNNGYWYCDIADQSLIIGTASTLIQRSFNPSMLIGESTLGSLADAIIHAMQNFEPEQKRNRVDRVEVCNETGALCFQRDAKLSER